jgi:pimeloyl-ACP methyl ester carboxylesterase
VPGSFLSDDVPDAVRHAFVEQQTSLLVTSGLTSMIPNVTDNEKAHIEVPVLVAFGDHDLTDAYERSAARYTASHDVALYVLPGSAHATAGHQAGHSASIAEWMDAIAELA